jgi:hypothetical protein
MSRRLVSIYAVVGMLAGVFAAGCGGNSSSSSIRVAIASPSSAPTIEQGQTVNVSAAVTSSNNSMVNQGVTWALSGSGCTGAACGSLTNPTPTSVTYNAPASVSSNMTVSVTATSVENPSKSASINITVAAIAVTIQNKVTELAAGSGNFFSALFIASVQNDPTGSGVTWSLTANGAACSPGCGTLSLATSYSVNYTPPSSIPAAPANMPTITATSFTNPVNSDTDKFTIFDGSAACGTGGNESLLNGKYAILLQGWMGSGTGTPIFFGASFGADGTGKITGGADQFNPLLNKSESGAGLIPAASSYSVGPDNRGCLTLTDQFETTFTFHFSLGGVTGGIASKGDIILFNEQSSTPERGSGILRRQDPTAFSLSALAPNYALGADGWENSSGSLTHFALAGSFAQSGGSISTPSFDANDGGKMSSLVEPGVTNLGTIQPIATTTGMAQATLTVPGPYSGSANVTVYVISPSELFFISNDLGATFSGRAIATPSSFSASSISPNYILHFTGSSSGPPAVSIGLASFSGGISGTVSGSIDQYAGGTATNQNLTGTYAFTQLSGRLALNGAGSATSPVCYLTDPVDNVSALCISTDATASAGVFDTQPAATYGNSSLSGNFFFGSNEPGDNTVVDLCGVASISSGSLAGTKDASALAGFSLGSAFAATLTVNTDGSGNLGTNTAAVTNGKVLYFINEAAGAAAEVQVFEQ